MPGIDTINERVSEYSDHTYLVFRMGLGLVILLAGLHKLFAPSFWASYIAPVFASIFTSVGLSGTLFMTVNGVFETVFGLAILADRYTTVAAGLVSLSFVSILINLSMAGSGYTAIIIRDIGLLLLAVGVTLMAAERRTEG